MIRHVVMWKLKENLSDEEKEMHSKKIAEEIARLRTLVPGIIDLKVQTGALESSTMDLMLDSSFENEEALHAYQVHPEHQKIVQYVRSVVMQRACIDFETR